MASLRAEVVDDTSPAVNMAGRHLGWNKQKRKWTERNLRKPRRRHRNCQMRVQQQLVPWSRAF